VCQEDAYLKHLVVYIHLNPLRAVNDHPNGATHDRLNGAISSWPKSGFRTGFKLLQTSLSLLQLSPQEGVTF
jgi:hypothetical protein